MFAILRLMIGACLFGIFIPIIRKSKNGTKRKLYTILIIASILLTTALAFLPFENLIVTFPSPIAAYDYYYLPGKSDIELIVPGKTCDFIVDRQNVSDTDIIIFPKTDKGWKIGIGTNTKIIDHKISDEVSITVYQYKNTGEKFLTILCFDGDQASVSDAYNTKFYSLEGTKDPLGNTFVTYYAYIPNYDSQYCVMINDKIITINNAQEGQVDSSPS